MHTCVGFAEKMDAHDVSRAVFIILYPYLTKLRFYGILAFWLMLVSMPPTFWGSPTSIETTLGSQSLFVGFSGGEVRGRFMEGLTFEERWWEVGYMLRR